ncbi:uncharacterized protein TRAVEDRAFT_140212 [Trametes versicolor FP-101664 SS1]|uniref:uncharacterized protein n=1 Tax=Trametes versicolor (strain FP-101664) TaxID=717944 RepID=UPI00046234AB|nr:uncharacterized protein TRAVEDRAFT_140212 [Trametes versicolor FP-101664 SS1]EIW64911.1 hypothetical protein TRAVEDRAFT_140212 [Trametes versicolor FP-101664 SS1]
MGKKRKTSRASRESSEEPQFVVEVIKAARVTKEEEWEYRVKWANYDSSEDTWEPAGNLNNCKRLLDSFWDDIGIDDNDYHEGYTVHATPSWIKREKKYFARSLDSGTTSRADKEDELEATIARIKEGAEDTSRVPLIKKQPSTSKGKDVTKSSTGKKAGRPRKVTVIEKPESGVDRAEDSDDAPLSAIPRKRKKRVKLSSPDSDEADDDDVPLAKYSKPKAAASKGVASASSSAPSAVKTAPVVKLPEPAQDSDHESGGSLFSGPSSPEAAPAVPESASAAGAEQENTTIPMKRPSVDDVGANRHRKRQIKEMPMVITGTAGNSTKARLAQRGVQPAAAPAPATAGADGPGTRPFTQKLDLSSMSFKKKSATAAAAPSPIQTDSPTTPIVPIPRRTSMGNAFVQSPVSAEPPTPTGSTAPVPIPRTTDFKRPMVPIPRRTSLQLPPKDPTAEAESFLAGIMPPDLAAPMNEDTTPVTPTTPSAPGPFGKTKAPPLPRIAKKWRWSGEMFMDVSRERAERVCEISLHDPTEPLPNGLRFSICVKGDSLRLSAFHDIASLPVFLEACTRVQQFAKVAPQEDKDTDAIKQLAIYMMKRSLFCYAHLYIEETSVALLVIFPSGHPETIKFLNVPTGSAGEALLQAALVPWELKAKDFQKLHWKNRISTMGVTLDPAFIPMLDEAGRKVVTQRRFYQALHILQIPKSLYDFVAAPNHPYCIWYVPGDHSGSGPGYETMLLKEVLATCASKNVGYKADGRVVFVHVGALATLYCLPALAERRKYPEWRFITYGTHPSIPRERWGVRELYPIGGIVTFTPSAIIQGHFRLFQRISQIAEHPMWECYVLPSVVAMVAKLCCQGVHPLQVYDEGNFVYEDLLKAIEDGSVALLQAPQSTLDPPAQDDSNLLWTRCMIRVAGLDARGILEECLKLAAEQFANTSEADLPAAIEQEIVRDLLRMQTQPVIMDNYRRFVVFRTKQDAYFADASKSGIECTSHDKFDFKDDFFEASNDSEKK